jgi:ATP-dependent DNA helicase RecQ
MSSSDVLRVRSVMERLGYDTFKSPEQEELVMGVTAGKDALGILPTGGGKSAAFIIPTIACRWKTVVVSPLIALMTDQVNKLRKQGFRAYALHGEASQATWTRAALAATQSWHVFIYASPETLLTEKFARHFPNFNPNLLAIDEAHCVSTWGESFRPQYLRLPTIAKLLNNPQCLALSATIDPLIERDVTRRLPMRKDRIRVTMSPFRENLRLEVRQPGVNERFGTHRDLVAMKVLARILREDTEGATLVYCYTRMQAGQVYERSIRYAQKHGYSPILFHAEIPKEDKRMALDTFVNHPRPLVFCTSAFGMGIDRPDVRTVVHFDTPSTLVDYAQQIGRGGRDGKPTRCIAFYNPRRLASIEKNT